MTITAHVYQIYLAATPAQVWTAITDSDWTRRYFHSTAFVEPPTRGQPYRTVLPSGDPAIEGMVEEMTPPGPQQPGRFVQTWRVLYDTAMAEEPPSRVEWTVEEVGPGLTRVRLVHGDLAGSPLTWAEVKDGWVWILDSMKSLVETGSALPAPRDLAPVTTPTDADWHRRQAVEATNSTWELLTAPPSAEESEELVERAYAAAYHWQRASGAGPQNRARASYLVARALLASGQPEAALRAASRCLEVCLSHGIDDFDLAYAYEGRARALRALGRRDEAAKAWARATSVAVEDPEDRSLVAADFADYPG